MGVEFKLTLYHAKPKTAELAAKRSFELLKSLDDTLSDYQQNSELNLATAKAFENPVKCSPVLFELLTLSQSMFVRTSGLFDITVGPVVRLWRTSRKTQVLPTLSDLIHAKEQTGFEAILLNQTNQTLRVTKQNVKLDFGGIAKGYACDSVITLLKLNGISTALVEGGGDLACIGSPPGRKYWSISVPGLQKTLEVKNCAVSTSGSSEQFVEIEGRRYSHIVDPRTGLGLQRLRQVTVICAKGSESDPLATALCINSTLALPRSCRAIIVEGESL